MNSVKALALNFVLHNFSAPVVVWRPLKSSLGGPWSSGPPCQHATGHMYVISAVFQFFSKRFQRLYQIDTSCHHAKIYMYRRRNAGLQITAHTQPCLVSYHVLCFRNNNHDSNSHSARSQIS